MEEYEKISDSLDMAANLKGIFSSFYMRAYITGICHHFMISGDPTSGTPTDHENEGAAELVHCEWGQLQFLAQPLGQYSTLLPVPIGAHNLSFT